MEAATPPHIDTLDRPCVPTTTRRAAARLAWVGLDLLAIAGFGVVALQALT
jgi:hypothetical protein